MADPIVLTDRIPVYRGDTWRPAPWQRGTITDPVEAAAVAAGTLEAVDATSFEPYDYSEWEEWSAQWRPSEDSSTVIELTVDSSEAAIGKFGVSATAEQTVQMGVPGVFDVQVRSGAEVKTLLKAKTRYAGDVTRD